MFRLWTPRIRTGLLAASLVVGLVAGLDWAILHQGWGIGPGHPTLGWVRDVLTEASGLLFNVVLFGVILLWLEEGRSRRGLLEGWREELEDFQRWRAPEGAHRSAGLIRRLRRADVPVDALLRAPIEAAGGPAAPPGGAGARLRRWLGLPQRHGLRNAYLAGADLSGIPLPGVDLSGANLVGALLIDADLTGANLSGADLSGANLERTRLVLADLSGACLAGASVHWTQLSGANLSGADLSGAQLLEAKLQQLDLSGANLQRASVVGGFLDGADLSGADLRGASLSIAALVGADLSGANLSGADLIGAFLYKANLSGADLSDANLRGAYLQRTTLQGACLAGADLSGVQREPGDPEVPGWILSSEGTLLPDDAVPRPGWVGGLFEE